MRWAFHPVHTHTHCACGRQQERLTHVRPRARGGADSSVQTYAHHTHTTTSRQQLAPNKVAKCDNETDIVESCCKHLITRARAGQRQRSAMATASWRASTHSGGEPADQPDDIVECTQRLSIHCDDEAELERSRSVGAAESAKCCLQDEHDDPDDEQFVLDEGAMWQRRDAVRRHSPPAVGDGALVDTESLRGVLPR